MTQRERVLSILVGGLVVVLVLWWGMNRYRTAVQQRTTRLANLEDQKLQLQQQVLEGHLADRQMTEYLLRSLPGDAEQARSVYQQWLLTIGKQNNISDLTVDPTTTMGGDIFQRISFRFSGKADMPDITKLLYDFYAKDYLHLIRDLTIQKVRSEDKMVLEMAIDAVALRDAAADTQPPADRSWRIADSLAEYQDPILNRNLFEPPNAAPQFAGNSQIEAVAGRDTPVPLAFRDPEQHQLKIELAEEPPPFVRLDPGSGTLHINADEPRKFSLLVRATDNGYPSRSSEQRLEIEVVEPPEPEPEPPPQLAFDDATQTVLTGLVHGREDWTAWMHVRTRGETIKLRVGDRFEIGSLKGKVIEVTPKYVALEIDDRRFTLEPNGILKEAADRALQD